MDKYKFNIINIVDRPSKNASKFSKGEIDFGTRRLNKLITKIHPKVICFVGKITYKTYSKQKDINFGWQNNILSSKVYVIHFPVRGDSKTRIKELREIKKVI